MKGQSLPDNQKVFFTRSLAQVNAILEDNIYDIMMYWNATSDNSNRRVSQVVGGTSH